MIAPLRNSPLRNSRSRPAAGDLLRLAHQPELSGWRLYLSYADEPGRSFFRYRDPVSGEVVTSADGRWHLRFFEVSAERLFWHAIASDTHRFSVGWHVRPWSLRAATTARVKHLLGR